MKPATEFDENSTLCALFIGDPGSGKTSTALQFPGAYVLDCDDNLRPAKLFTKKNDFFYNVATKDDKGESIPPEKRYQHCVECINKAVASPEIKTIILDTIGTFSDIVCSEVKRQQGKADNAQMSLPDWGHFAYLIKFVITRLKSAGKNIIVTAHNKRVVDEATGAVNIFVNVPGQSKDNLSGLFSDVILFFSDQEGFGASAKDVRKVRTIPTRATDHRGAKGSLGLPAELKLDDFIAKIPNLLNNEQKD